MKIIRDYNIHLISAPEGVNVSLEEVEENIEIQGETKLFPEGTDITCFVIQLATKEKSTTVGIQQLYFITKTL